MLILLSFANRRRRRVRAAWMAAFVCAVCLERLAALHAPVAGQAAASAWVLNGVPPPVASPLLPNHARFMAQHSGDDDSRGSQASVGRPGDLLAAELPADFPYAER
jgi:hypothetical protein